MKAHHTGAVLREHAVEHQRVDMHVEIERPAGLTERRRARGLQYNWRARSLTKIDRPGCGMLEANRMLSAVRTPGSAYDELKMLLITNCAVKPGRKST